MGIWNHRVVRQIHEGETWLGIHEAFYDIEGETVWTNDPVSVQGESIADLRETLERMLRALDTPIIDDTKEAGNGKV